MNDVAQGPDAGWLRLSRLGLGTSPLGNLFAAVSEEAARETVVAAWKAGLRVFDTAPLYGSGLAERRLGAALSELPRDELVLSTKVGRLLRPGGRHDPLFVDACAYEPTFDFSREAVRRSLAGSLARLRTDRIDIALVHDPDHHAPEALDEALPALAELREEGVVRAVGVGMTHASRLERFVQEADLDCILIAGRYTLLDQSAAETLLPLCRERRVAVLLGGVFNSGILAGTGSGTYDYGPAPQEVARRVAELDRVCSSFGVPLAAAALQFAAAHPAVDTVLIGARSVAEVAAAVTASTWGIPANLWLELAEQGLLPRDLPTPAEPAG
jgi:D-threo-aldose 1-dehydrogenase